MLDLDADLPPLVDDVDAGGVNKFEIVRLMR